MLISEFADDLEQSLKLSLNTSRISVKVEEAEKVSYVYISVVITAYDGVTQYGVDRRVHVQDIKNVPHAVIHTVVRQAVNHLINLSLKGVEDDNT